MRDNKLSVYFGHHDSCVTFASGNSIELHLEAERVFRKKHMRVNCEQMNELICKGLDYLKWDIQDIGELYVAKWNNQFEEEPIILGRRFKPILTGHHANHIGTGFPSGLTDAIVVCADGGSEDGTTKVYFKKGSQIELLDDLDTTILTGKFYGTITQVIIEPRFGRAHDTAPGKTMGLAAWGMYDSVLEQLIQEHKEEINKLHFDGCDKIREKLGISVNYVNPWADKRRKDLAFVAQKVWEDGFVRQLRKYSGLSKNLILTGGCAYNVNLNTRLQDSELFDKIFVSPVSGDCGQSLGALLFHNPQLNCEYPYLGRSFGEVSNVDKVVKEVVRDLVNHKIVAWYQGRSEVGARALGHRSFLGIPDSTEMRDRLSIEIKKREPYRPVAPIIIADEVSVWFETTTLSPYMTFAPKATDCTRKKAPAIVHADNTSRLQIVSLISNPVMYQILTGIKEITKVPILMNTSLNVAAEPIVDTPEDAYKIFKKSGADVLYINGERYVC